MTREEKRIGRHIIKGVNDRPETVEKAGWTARKKILKKQKEIAAPHFRQRCCFLPLPFLLFY